ncbi:MAG: helix-turn-helix domain-containing protein [Bacteroidota bacterium]
MSIFTRSCWPSQESRPSNLSGPSVLQQAAQLLEKSQLSVSEIAYKVGFNNPKYFTKYFKEEYKVLPSAYASRNE